MIHIDSSLTCAALQPACEAVFAAAIPKILQLDRRWRPDDGAPVFTANARYTARGWTEWTQGFVYGAPLLAFEATGDRALLDLGRNRTRERMAPHLTHIGVHDHGFNNVSTYGTLLRQMREGLFEASDDERAFYELALKVSGAVQAARWTPRADGGFIHSFNGPHSLFADTIRSLRALALSHRLGHRLHTENDRTVSLLHRLIEHGQTTARFNVYFGRGRDAYDQRGRVAHESIFNVTDGAYRCPSSQQGYSPFTTWTRGHAWVLCGFAEQLEFLATVPRDAFPPLDRDTVLATFQEAAEAAADFYLEHTPIDGIPYWDTGAPGLAAMPDHAQRPADPFNSHEPVDSSAAAIAAQGLARLGRILGPDSERGRRYHHAALTTARTLFAEPYLSRQPDHEGLLLHTVYHRPNGWDCIPPHRAIPCGEAAQWGDYHALELALLLLREAQGRPWLTFFN